MKFIASTLLLLGTASFALAGDSQVPEIDGNTAMSALALLSGGFVVLRARRKK